MIFLNRQKHASTLMMTLWVAALILVVGLALASLATNHLQFGSKLDVRIRTEAACEAMISQALEKIVVDPEYGIDQEPEDSLELELNGAQVYLSFNPDQASDWGIPLSQSNRFNVESALSDDGTLIPANAVILFAVARKGSIERTLEVVVQIPEFPYAIAASGQLTSTGELVVGAVESLEDLEGSIDPDTLNPGDLVSNESVEVSGNATITGTVRSFGSVTLGTSVRVHGDVMERAEKIEMVDIDVTSLRPDDSQTFSPSHAATISDARHSTESFVALTGGLTLDQGVLYVNGDLHVSGGLEGEGAIICNGSVTIDGGANLAAEDQLAIVAQGDVNISGAGRSSSIFQGLIYTEGDLNAENTTLLGVFVANGSAAAVSSGSVSLKDANVLLHPEYSRFHMDGTVFLVYQNPDGSFTQDSSGDKELFLFSIDEGDVGAIMGAAGAKNAEGAPGDGDESFNWIMDLGPYLPLIRLMRASTRDGVLTSDWTEYDEAGITDVLGSMAIVNNRRPPTGEGDMNGVDWSSLYFSGHEADPDLAIVRQIRTSFFFDLNQFLAPSSRTRTILWKTR